NGPPPRPAPKVEAEAPEAAPIPVAEAIRNSNLDEMREQVVACAACGLCKGRRNAVFGHGGQPTRWLVVGEAPGEQEDRQGQPFVGRSGQLLDAMLSAVSMSRERDVFITNVIKCRPPGNRNPKPEEIAACSPYLMRQIALLKPERILVLGRFAAQTLLGTDATIGSLRGRIHHLKTNEGRQIPVVVSYHPAYLLRSPGEKARAWQDLKLAARMD
ncbi:uracil-DNA glycosylase, partial [Achromobacter denitrificans]|uniref:uracil-DNA glycosylase n=1 Tax=Achromobacter denitrificans TaxID=32002 RepID=UPI001E60C88F